MKKYLFIITVGLLFARMDLFAQNVVIQQNTSKESLSTQPSNEYYINGISTREDIGGVEIEWGIYNWRNNQRYYKPTFINYRDFAVRVIFKIGDKTGTIVLQGYEKKRAI